MDRAVQNHRAHAALAMGARQPLDPVDVHDEGKRHVVEHDVELFRPVGVLVPLDQHVRRLAGGVIDGPVDLDALGHGGRQDLLVFDEIVKAAAGHVEPPDRARGVGLGALTGAPVLLGA